MIRFSTIILLSLTLWLTGCAGVNTWSSSDTNATKQAKIQATKNKRAVAKARAANLNTQDFSKIQDPSNDLWQRVRDGFEIQDPQENALIIKHVNQLASNPVYVNRLLQRSSYYLFYIEEEVEARDMPSELALLPFVESAFNPKAVSPAKAAGMWQFMPATGKDFKLTQNVFRDERRDVIQSTDAALDYLQRLYKMFGDWQLVLAAYNWGEGNVSKAIKRNQAQNLPTDYASLKMPDETRNYVPKLLAVKKIVLDSKSYGLTLPKLENHPYFVVVTTSKDVDVSLAAQFARMTVEEFRAMNPSFNKPVILGASEPQILLPYGRAQSFQENLNAYKGRLSSWTAIRLGARETVDQLATRLNVEAHQIREINDIPKGMRIKAGSTVIVPKVGKSKDVPEHLANNTTQLLLEKEVAAKKKGAKKKGAKSSGSAKKTASNSGSGNKASDKAKPRAESKVASNSKKSN